MRGTKGAAAGEEEWKDESLHKLPRSSRCSRLASEWATWDRWASFAGYFLGMGEKKDNTAKGGNRNTAQVVSSTLFCYMHQMMDQSM
jgi:hypothetical protein